MIPLLDLLVRETDELDFTTVALCRLGRRRRKARISLAGHPPPVVQAAGSAPRFVVGGATAPLSTGIGPAPSVEVPLGEGTRLVFYTDGLVERRGRSLDDGRCWRRAPRSRIRIPPATSSRRCAGTAAGSPTTWSC